MSIDELNLQVTNKRIRGDGNDPLVGRATAIRGRGVRRDADLRSNER